MLLRTHFVVGLCAVLLFIEHVNNPLALVLITLIATIIPDIDSGFSTIGKHKIFKILQFFTKHRGVIHSFSFCIVISILFSFFLPWVAFPFFLGYSIHLFLDSFTKEGIYPFWPYARKAQWKVKTGGAIDDTLFVGFIVLDVMLLVLLLGF